MISGPGCPQSLNLQAPHPQGTASGHPQTLHVPPLVVVPHKKISKPTQNKPKYSWDGCFMLACSILNSWQPVFLLQLAWRLSGWKLPGVFLKQQQPSQSQSAQSPCRTCYIFITEDSPFTKTLLRARQPTSLWWPEWTKSTKASNPSLQGYCRPGLSFKAWIVISDA